MISYIDANTNQDSSNPSAQLADGVDVISSNAAFGAPEPNPITPPRMESRDDLIDYNWREDPDPEGREVFLGERERSSPLRRGRRITALESDREAMRRAQSSRRH
jgi:hypothetical protein